MSTPKVLVVGSANGQFEKVFHKISKLHAKQGFSFAILIGDLFGSDSSDESENQLNSLLNGLIKVPIPTYFSLGNHGLPKIVQDRLEANGEVCTNLFYLGRKGTLKTTEGIRIVNLGGRLLQNEASLTQAIGKYDPLYTDADAKTLHGAHSADILITNQWPVRITKNSQVPVPDSIDINNSSESIANLCLALKPRYHFASSSMAAWTREPFMVPASLKGRQIKSYEELDGPVRFTSLADISAPNKECLSAFNLDPTKPASTEGAQQTCPLNISTPMKRKREYDEDNSYRYSRDQQHESRPKRNIRKQRNFDPSNCFMCTSNDSFDSDMVISIAEDSILTVLKGPLPIPGVTFPQLKSSGHIMIIPMYHAADEASHGKRDLQDMEREFSEMTRYRHSLQQMMGSKGLGAICWEVNRTGIRHFHWQLIACQIDEIRNGMIEAAYKVAAEAYQVKSQDEEGKQIELPTKFINCNPDTLIPDRKSDFFRVWIWQPDDSKNAAQDSDSNNNNNDISASTASKKIKSPIEQADSLSNGHEQESTDVIRLPVMKGSEKSMYFPIPASMSFNISFGREVMAGILQLEQRSDWRSIESGNGIEAADAQAWQEEFQRPNGEENPGWDFAMA